MFGINGWIKLDPIASKTHFYLPVGLTCWDKVFLQNRLQGIHDDAELTYHL